MTRLNRPGLIAAIALLMASSSAHAALNVGDEVCTTAGWTPIRTGKVTAVQQNGQLEVTSYREVPAEYYLTAT